MPSVPANLLLFGSLASAGDRIPVSSAAAAATIPLRVGPWIGGSPAQEPFRPWLTDVVSVDGKGRSTFTSLATELLDDASAATIKTVGHMASIYSGVTGCAAADVLAAIRPLAEWLMASKDGLQPTDVVASLRNLISCMGP